MKLYLIIVMLNSFLTASSQDSACKFKLINDQVSFTLYTNSMDFTNKNNRLKAETVIVTSIKDALSWKLIKSLPVQEWICLLNNPKSDWAANLILYQIYEKDAIIFKFIKRKEDWVGIQKEKDIVYWKTFLETRSVSK